MNWIQLKNWFLKVDLFCFQKKFLVFNLVGRNLKVKYKRSVGGFLWTILVPTVLAIVYYFVFKVLLKISIKHYLMFILTGMLHWNFFQQTLLETVECFVASAGLLTKIPIPYPVFPFVAAVTNGVTLLISVVLLLFVGLFSGVEWSASLCLFPWYLFVLFLITHGLASIGAVVFVFFRDLRHIIQISLSILYYMTPVVYDFKMVPEKYKWILFFNPFVILFQDLQMIWIHGGWPQKEHFLFLIAWVIFIFGLTRWVYQKFTRNMVELL